GAGMFSGLMLSQYTADMQTVEQRILSMPSCVQSIPAAADQEDFVSMGMNGVLKNLQIMDNAYGILGIEYMAAAQALDLREKFDDEKYKLGDGTKAAKDAIRKHVEYLDIDRPLYPDHNKMKDLVASCEILHEVEKVVGSLE
ncbi:MAG: aromatic amino acid lyase, partial [Bacteroidota bacterium]